MDKEFVKDLCDKELEYMFLCSLISADNVNSEKDANDMLNYLAEFEEALNESDVDKTKKDELNHFIKKSRDILNKDIKRFEESK